MPPAGQAEDDQRRPEGDGVEPAEEAHVLDQEAPDETHERKGAQGTRGEEEEAQLWGRRAGGSIHAVKTAGGPDRRIRARPLRESLARRHQPRSTSTPSESTSSAAPAAAAVASSPSPPACHRSARPAARWLRHRLVANRLRQAGARVGRQAPRHETAAVLRHRPGLSPRDQACTPSCRRDTWYPCSGGNRHRNCK